VCVCVCGCVCARRLLHPNVINECRQQEEWGVNKISTLAEKKCVGVRVYMSVYTTYVHEEYTRILSNKRKYQTLGRERHQVGGQRY